MRDEIIDLERRFWASAGDAAFYRDNFAEDGRCVFGFGVLDKGATVASMEAAEPWSTYDLHDIEVLPVDRDTAVLVYSVAAARGEQRYRAVVSSVYVRRDDRWRLAIHHQTPQA